MNGLQIAREKSGVEKKNFIIWNNQYYICSIIGSDPDIFQGRIKMGIRLKSGAIPVAVKWPYFIKVRYLQTHATVRIARMGRQKKTLSQKTCHLFYYSTLSGERLRGKWLYCIYVSLFFPDIKDLYERKIFLGNLPAYGHICSCTGFGYST